MEKVVEDWLAEYSASITKEKYLRQWAWFTEWCQKTASEFVEEYNQATDKKAWATETGKLILRYYNYLITEHPRKDVHGRIVGKGLKTNSARTMTIGVRAFFGSQCQTVKIKRGSIAKAKIALGEHFFSLSELQHMYKIADVRERAVLATALCLGWSAEDFVNLRRDFITPYLTQEASVGFWYERGKTHAITRAHLTHEAIDALKTWLEIAPESEYIFSNSTTEKPMNQDTLNDIIKNLYARTQRQPRGRIRFHLLRKFLMSALANSGINEWHVKLMIGKTIPSDILTYLKDQTETIREEYQNAHERFTLTSFTNSNHSKINEMETKLENMERAITRLSQDNLAYKTTNETLTKQLNEVAKDYAFVNALIEVLSRANPEGKEAIIKAMLELRKKETEETK